MKNIRNLLNQLAVQERSLLETRFLAPCVRKGQVRTKVSGFIYIFQTKPPTFAGWGIFQPIDEKLAEVVDEPSLPQLTEYLQLLLPMRLQLAYPLKGQTWLAYPANESDAKQRLGFVKPMPVHLVTEGAAFETAIARWDGHSWWFEGLDRRADPQSAEALKAALKQVTPPEAVRFKGMTPEMRVVYELVTQQAEEFNPQWQKKHQEKDLRKALQMGGGELQDFSDRQDYWLVEWTTASGERHTSAIDKTDLTVISAGICLSGFDKDFDLQSLVGVVEQR